RHPWPTKHQRLEKLRRVAQRASLGPGSCFINRSTRRDTTATMSRPAVYFKLPTPPSFPDDLPYSLPPPTKERTFRQPFGIHPWIYDFALEPAVPLVFASLYILTVLSLNAYNKSRNNKPWDVSKYKAFKYFVVLHNVALAVYSWVTFAAMTRAFAHTWPGWNNPNGAAGIADALCKLHGPRGLGDAATFNTTINIWEVKNQAIRLTPRTLIPDSTDVGRLWNEGLAFWGWIFYLSKFYEVVDTLIILAKGKRSATLQTYHHAGAMICMWAGIRYMSPPIWMFVFINSGIHGLMYIYFSLSALGYRVSPVLKRTLTSMQIAQFLFGASYAAAHLFIQYDIPIRSVVQVPYTVQEAISSATSAAAAATSSVSSIIATPTAGSWVTAIKKGLLLAAGHPGVAELVGREGLGAPGYHGPPGHENEPLRGIPKKTQEFVERRYMQDEWRQEWSKVNCIDTTGEAFAIYLNLFYLAPLTFLFARFFVRAYTQRGKPRTATERAKRFQESGRQARKDTRDEVERRGQQAEDAVAKRGSEAGQKLKQGASDVRREFQEDVKRMRDGTYEASRRVSDRVAQWDQQAKSAIEKARQEGKQIAEGGKGSPRRGSPAQKDDSAIQDESEEQQPQQSGYTSQGKSDGKPGLGSGSNNQSEAKQDKNLGSTEPLRNGAGADGASGDDKEDHDSRSDGLGLLGSGARNESEDKQDANLDETKAVRPGDDAPASPSTSRTAKEEDESTDAMGKSGSIIDLSKEKAKDATDGDETYADKVKENGADDGAGDNGDDDKAEGQEKPAPGS
ncbi:putative fatty acid elongation protein 4, partial [Teratosphaeria destructans]